MKGTSKTIARKMKEKNLAVGLYEKMTKNYKQDAEQKTKEKLLRIFLSIELEMV